MRWKRNPYLFVHVRPLKLPSRNFDSGVALDDVTIAHLDDPLAGSGCFGIVCNHYDRLIETIIQLAKHLQNQFGILRIEISGWFVGQDNCRAIHHGPGQSDPLLLSPRQLQRLVMQLVL